MAVNWADFGLSATRHRLAAGTLAVFVFVMLAIGITTLARQALDQLRLLNTANSDNLQWTLSQTEVEFLLYYNAALYAAAGPEQNLQNLRNRFDIFYSRIDTIRRGPIYGRLANKPQMTAEFAKLDAFIARTVPYVDSTDADLRARLPVMISEAASLRADIRAISLEGIRVFSEIADMQRQSISDTMLRIAMLTVSLILLLMLALALLARIYGTTRSQAMENKSVRERLQAMLNTSLDAVLVVDRNGHFVEFNGAATEIFGYTAGEALGRDMTQLIFADHMIAAHNAGMKRHLETGTQKVIGAGRVQVEAKRKSGEVFPVELSVAKTMSPDGEIFVSYLRDISDRLQAEQNLTKARDEALAGERAKARFMAVMSHEMRTPLNGLLGALQLLKSTNLTEKQREFSDVMQKTGALLLHHVSDVLDISRLESGKVVGDLVPLDVDALVREVLDTQSAIARTKGLELLYRPEAGAIGVMMGSAIGLRQVLLNLVSNAIKFTDKGLVEVQASLTDAAQGGGKKRLSLRVRDTGIGISLADQARVFDDFVTLDSSFGRRADGTGLGLGIARRIVTSMQGEIGLISQEGFGSTFWVDLPFDRAPARAQRAVRAATTKTAKAEPARKAAAPAQLDILVMEDNQINRFVLREMLGNEGHRVTEAVDGLEGVALAQTRRFDVIFTDISMPKLDGIAATVRLRAGNGPCADVPIIALTAHAMAEDRALFLASGMNAVLNKPLDRAMLTHVLREVTLPPQRAAGANSAPNTPPKRSPRPRKTAPPQTPVRPLAAGAIAAQAGPEIIRAATLTDLKTALGAARLGGLTDRYLAEGDSAVASSEALLARGDYPAAQAVLHSFAGASATFGALAIQALLAQMEADIKAGRGAAAGERHGDLAALWAQTRSEMVARLAA